MHLWMFACSGLGLGLFAIHADELTRHLLLLLLSLVQLPFNSLPTIIKTIKVILIPIHFHIYTRPHKRLFLPLGGEGSGWKQRRAGKSVGGRAELNGLHEEVEPSGSVLGWVLLIQSNPDLSTSGSGSFAARGRYPSPFPS